VCNKSRNVGLIYGAQAYTASIEGPPTSTLLSGLLQTVLLVLKIKHFLSAKEKVLLKKC
jgi:hypothetical protein